MSGSAEYLCDARLASWGSSDVEPDITALHGVEHLDAEHSGVVGVYAVPVVIYAPTRRALRQTRGVCAAGYVGGEDFAKPRHARGWTGKAREERPVEVHLLCPALLVIMDFVFDECESFEVV